ncbi:lgals3bpa [Symbiodinium pilosum]|uniref:Lgals3bpa protein n=1 Tax=Symbiodinium pilosum TaxID=2952 RepID=A0A812K0J1_SYMPI|nr:lgals3bpa [Symbiodinium pilosum]
MHSRTSPLPRFSPDAKKKKSRQTAAGVEWLGQGSSDNLGDEPSELGSNLRAVDFDNHEVRAVSAGFGHTCVLLDDDSTRCFGLASAGQLGQENSLSIGAKQGQMGTALAVTELFVVTLRAGFEGLSLSEDSQSILQVQHGGLVGLICDDGFDTAAAQVACRDLGMAGGITLSVNAHNGTIPADNVRCTGDEVSLRDCRFSGWHLHDCTPQEAAGTDFWVGSSFVAALFTASSFFPASCVIRGDTQARMSVNTPWNTMYSWLLSHLKQ